MGRNYTAIIGKSKLEYFTGYGMRALPVREFGGTGIAGEDPAFITRLLA